MRNKLRLHTTVLVPVDDAADTNAARFQVTFSSSQLHLPFTLLVPRGCLSILAFFSIHKDNYGVIPLWVTCMGDDSHFFTWLS